MDGSPIKVGGKKYTGKGKVSKTYQCPFGEFELRCHVYRSNEGEATYCPLDRDGRIPVFSTPKFAKMVSSKYSQIGAEQVQRDLRDNLLQRYVISLKCQTFIFGIFVQNNTIAPHTIFFLIFTSFTSSYVRHCQRKRKKSDISTHLRSA
jgi:hypothetical protein